MMLFSLVNYKCMCKYAYVFFFDFLKKILGPHPWYMEVPRLGFRLELQMLGYTAARATPDPSCLCDLCHSLWQHCILNRHLLPVPTSTHLHMHKGQLLPLIKEKGLLTHLKELNLHTQDKIQE